jgi:TolA-binding protein
MRLHSLDWKNLTISFWTSLFLFLFLFTSSHGQQLTPDQQAEMILSSARRAHNEKNYGFAATRFREFLAKFGNHKDAASARYGLALTLFETQPPDLPGALEQLQPLAGNKDFADYPFVLYYLASVHRGLGIKDLEQAKPVDATQKRASAQQHFEEAARQFAAAAPAFAARVKELKPDAKEIPKDFEWSARARCDQVEMLLRTSKPKEAQALAAPFAGAGKDPADALFQKSQWRNLGLYYHGYASFLLKDYLTAGRSLNMLAPFSDPAFGGHARFLLARVHHESEELNEATRHYEIVLTDYDTAKKSAAEALKQPDQFKNNLREKARLEALTRDPPPDHVAQAAFYLGVLQYEGGRFAEALTHFAAFASQYSRSPLVADAELRAGFCQIQLRQFPEAMKILQPIADKEPRLADQASFWIAKAQVGSADANNPSAYAQTLKIAIDTFRRAGDKAQALTTSDPEARNRKGEILLELGDSLQLARQANEAVAVYKQMLNEKLLASREEEVQERLASALHLAGDYAGSDQACMQFQKTYPKSSLLPAVLFRHAENAHFLALAAERANNKPERDRWNDEAGRRYQALVEKNPDFQYAGLTRYGWAMISYGKGDWEKAKEILEVIPAGERTGSLAAVPYLLADCLLRTAPIKADDALAAGKAQELLQGAVEMLEGFVAAQPPSPQVPDALLKLGLCYQRLAGLLADQQERAKMFASARTAYEKLMNQFPKDPNFPQAVFERAKVMAQAGDAGGAIVELQRFQHDPLKNSAIAPMATIRLAIIYRGQNKPMDAANLLSQARQQHEAGLLKDPSRAGWAPPLQFQHAAALQEAGKLADARGIFEGMIKQFPASPESAEAALRRGQCMKEAGRQKLEAAAKRLSAGQIKPEESAALTKQGQEAIKEITDSAAYLTEQAGQLKQKEFADLPGRMLYEAAWTYRLLGSDSPARTVAPADQLRKSDDKAKEMYQALVAAYPDLPISVDARFELAELLSEQGKVDDAVKLLNEALDKEPQPELAEKIRLRLGACYTAKKDAKSALAQFDAVARNAKSPLFAQAHYRAGECLLMLGDPAQAATRLAAFRDQQPLQNIPGLSDRALLRLGHAYEKMKQWDQSRQAHEQLVGRFSQSPWVNEARYSIGWAWQNQKQYDQAVNIYNQVIASTATEVAARAQLNIGMCRLEQKQYVESANAFLIVSTTYDYPELTAAALTEAARAYAAMKEHTKAERLLRRVLQDHPKSRWAEVAQQRLNEVKDQKQ